MELIQLIPKKIKDMNRTELRHERKAQQYLRSRVRMDRKCLEYKMTQRETPTIWQLDKVEFLELYERCLNAIIDEIEYYMPRRAEGKYKGSKESVVQSWKDKRKKLELHYLDENLVREFAKVRGIGTNLSWDREKFMLVARDRGYLTEESIIQAVCKEVRMERARGRVLLDQGKFTWGQILCIGALLEMTPKEFCDIFLAGYFVESHDQYVASLKNLNKDMLLKSATMPKRKSLEEDDPYKEVKDMMANMEQTEIEVDASGSPIEEEWFE